MSPSAEVVERHAHLEAYIDEHRGECLHDNPKFRGLVIHVRCRCENWNRCAACGELLGDRRLNAPYLDPDDGRVWYVPGFMGFRHRCGV